MRGLSALHCHADAPSHRKCITIGQKLKEQKEALPHGSFLPWIAAEFAMTAQNFMKIAAQYLFEIQNGKAVFELTRSKSLQPPKKAATNAALAIDRWQRDAPS